MAYILRDSFGREFPLPGVTRIGRDHTCQIVLADGEVSHFHATLWEQTGVLYLRDEVSRNGTFVNGQRVQQAALRPGDQVRIGSTVLVVGVAGARPIAQPLPAYPPPAAACRPAHLPAPPWLSCWPAGCCWPLSHWRLACSTFGGGSRPQPERGKA